MLIGRRGWLHIYILESSKATFIRQLACRARGTPSKQSSPLHVPAYLREGHPAGDALEKMKAAKKVSWKQVWHQADLFPSITL